MISYQPVLVGLGTRPRRQVQRHKIEAEQGAPPLCVYCHPPFMRLHGLGALRNREGGSSYAVTLTNSSRLAP